MNRTQISTKIKFKSVKTTHLISQKQISTTKTESNTQIQSCTPKQRRGLNQNLKQQSRSKKALPKLQIDTSPPRCRRQQESPTTSPRKPTQNTKEKSNITQTKTKEDDSTEQKAKAQAGERTHQSTNSPEQGNQTSPAKRRRRSESPTRRRGGVNERKRERERELSCVFCLSLSSVRNFLSVSEARNSKSTVKMNSIVGPT